MGISELYMNYFLGLLYGELYPFPEKEKRYDPCPQVPKRVFYNLSLGRGGERGNRIRQGVEYPLPNPEGFYSPTKRE